MIAGGADIVEIGVPFSDPLADGTTVQRVSLRLWRTARRWRSASTSCARPGRDTGDPVRVHELLNPVLAYGLERFAADAGTAGADAIILVDLPPEEAESTKSVRNAHGLDLIFLAAPPPATSAFDRRRPRRRLHLLCQRHRRHRRTRRSGARPRRLRGARASLHPRTVGGRIRHIPARAHRIADGRCRRRRSSPAPILT